MTFFEGILLGGDQSSIRLAHDASSCERGVVGLELAESERRLDALPERGRLAKRCAEYPMVNVQHGEGFQLARRLSWQPQAQIQRRLGEPHFNQM